MRTIKKVIFAIIPVLIIVAASGIYLYVSDSIAKNENPKINKVQKVGVYWEYADTTRFCDSKCKEYYRIYLKDSIEVIDKSVKCANCKSHYGYHKSFYDWARFDISDL